RAGRDDGREPLLSDDAVLLLLRVRGARPRVTDRLRSAPAAMNEERAPRFAAAITWLMTALFFATAFLLAVVIPIHAQDALTFGEWSRLISAHWHLHYAAATAQEYGRPLFYVLQGWLWGVFGFNEPSGRILSGLFSILLLGALVWLVRDRDWGRLAGLLAAVALLYDLSQARYVHQGLRTFLQAGVNTDYYRTLADEARRYALLDGNWFGDGLRVASIFALAYALLRLVGVRHRLAVLVGVPCALAGSWLGPWIAAHEGKVTVGSLHSVGA